jgi:hypothetical protein
MTLDLIAVHPFRSSFSNIITVQIILNQEPSMIITAQLWKYEPRKYATSTKEKGA